MAQGMAMGHVISAFLLFQVFHQCPFIYWSYYGEARPQVSSGITGDRPLWHYLKSLPRQRFLLCLQEVGINEPVVHLLHGSQEFGCITLVLSEGD